MIGRVKAGSVESYAHSRGDKPTDRGAAFGTPRKGSFTDCMQKFEFATLLTVVLVDWHGLSLPRTIVHCSVG